MGLVTNDRKSKKLINNFNIHLELPMEALLLHEHDSKIYSYFEKGCRKKVHATILKGIVGDFKYTVFQGNLKESYGRPLIYVCECWRKVTKVGSTATVVRNSVLIISHITFRDCRVHFILDKLSRNSCMQLREQEPHLNTCFGFIDLNVRPIRSMSHERVSVEWLFGDAAKSFKSVISRTIWNRYKFCEEDVHCMCANLKCNNLPIWKSDNIMPL